MDSNESRPATSTTETAAACPVCAHGPEAHGPIGLHFCATTAEQKFERRCICVGEQAPGPYYVRYRSTTGA
ncbi:RGCVC family protein [Smaragdicoccus niigatensis]|uniref:RGCVC family protein n=1 Tax=Smaragdicoccus niigatensis TaxID=359359 RepID=UPI001B7FBE84